MQSTNPNRTTPFTQPAPSSNAMSRRSPDSGAAHMQQQVKAARDSGTDTLMKKLTEVAQDMGVEPEQLLLALLDVVVSAMQPGAQSAGQQAVPEAPSLDELATPQQQNAQNAGQQATANPASLGDPTTPQLGTQNTGRQTGASPFGELLDPRIAQTPATPTVANTGNVPTTAPGAIAPAGSSIPPPVSDVQTLNLGGTAVTLGNDGTGTTNAADVQALASTMQTMYDGSPAFRASITNSPNGPLQVSVGKRDDNTSWGGSGSVFLNLNNVSAQNSDVIQSLIAHEFAHATNDTPHGPELEAYEARVATETPG